jgi:hypothetical protein
LKHLLAALVVVAALAAAGGASAEPLRYGVADDWPKFHPCGDVWWTSVRDIGYQDLRLTVQWDGTETIPFVGNIQAAVDCALLNNVRPILAVYPARPSLIGSNDSAQAAFASFVGLVGTAFPLVTNFVVGNEPNVNRFWQPQFVGGVDAAGADYEHTLAKSYDTLKTVRPDATVWGPATSSRGNDNPYASSNPSHSPVLFIKDMGDAYRASARTTPIFDEFDMHPYPPAQDTDAFSKPFHSPQAGAANLDRIKQALWDAFHGTGQPTPAEQPGLDSVPTLPIDLDEAGSQTVVAGHDAAYTDSPESIHPISEELQAKHYTDLMEIAACDPAVKTLLFFPLIDEPDVHNGFQSGSLFADLGHKLSYDAIKAKIASTGGLCQGGITGVPQAWQHTDSVVGARATFGGPAQACRSFGATASENATFDASLERLDGPDGMLDTTIARTSGRLKAYVTPLVRFRGTETLGAGYYQYSVRLRADTNPARTATRTRTWHLTRRTCVR